MAASDDDRPAWGIPFLDDVASMLGGEADIWDGARQAATQLAADGSAEHNVDPAARHRLSEIGRVAQLHVATVTGLGPTASLHAATRSAWAADALDAVRPLMDRLSERLHSTDDADTAEPDPFAGLLAMLSPMTVAMTAGMMAGHLAATALGSSDLLVPRSQAQVVTANVVGFAAEWGLDVDDVMLWVAIREHAMHAVLSVPHVRNELDRLLAAYVEGFRRSDASLESLGGLELPTTLDAADAPAQLGAQLQRIFGNPELLLGVSRDDSQNDTAAQLETLLSTLTAYVGDAVAQAGPRLIGGFDALREAMRRRHAAPAGTDFADRLLGVRLSAEALDRGNSFVAGVIERAGREGLSRLFEPGGLPTPNEVAAPGLWLARLELLL